MSNELAIAAVTLTLRNLFHEFVKVSVPAASDGTPTPSDLSSTTTLSITMQPPFKARDASATGNQLNLFLYRTEVNQGWRNAPPPQTRPGEQAMPPLALNLDYLISAYGEGDNDVLAQYFLGQVMRLLHDHAVMPRDRLHDALAASDINRQVESVTISPKPLSVEEISKLWTIFGTPYRISASYLVTVVLIDSRQPRRIAPPVLRRGKDDTGNDAIASAPPILFDARPASGLPAARLGDDVVISGQSVENSSMRVRLTHPLLAAPVDRDVTSLGSGRLQLHIPSIADDAHAGATFPPGLYMLTLLSERPDQPLMTSNTVSFALAPVISFDNTAVTASGTAHTITVTARPRIRPEQRPLLIFGNRQLAPASAPVTPGDDTQPTTVDFDADISEPGTYLVRLRVDGIDSPVMRRNTTTGLLEFDPAQTLVVNP